MHDSCPMSQAADPIMRVKKFTFTQGPDFLDLAKIAVLGTELLTRLHPKFADGHQALACKVVNRW